MARYNTSLASNSISGSTTIGTPYSGAFTELTGSAPYTVTLPSPVLFPGQNQTFYNATSGIVTLSSPSGNFTGSGGPGSSTYGMPAGTVASFTSDGTNYITISEDGSPLTATTGLFSGDVTMNGSGATVSVTPQTLTLYPSSSGAMDRVNIGVTTRGSGAFNTLTANAAVTFTAGTASGSYTAGTVVITGGLGVSGNINSNATIAATALNGPLTGTIQTAAQPNITSLGSLTGLTVAGSSVIANNTSINPDSYQSKVVAGAISDGSWGVSAGIGGNGGANGKSWAIGHNGSYLYHAVGDNTSNTTLASYLVVGGTTRHLWVVPTSGGNVGVGLSEGTVPSAKLHVSGTGKFTGTVTVAVTNSTGDGDNNNPMQFSQDYSSWASLWAGSAGSANGWGIFWAGNQSAKYGTNGTGGPGNVWSNSTNPNEAVLVGNGVTRWTCFLENGKTWQQGDLFCAGNVYSSYSDTRLKTILKPLENSLDKLAQIETFYYEPNDLAKSFGITGGVQLGVSAQSVKAVFPELVNQSAVALGYDTVQYDRLVTVLVDAVNQLTKRVQELESKIKD